MKTTNRITVMFSPAGTALIQKIPQQKRALVLEYCMTKMIEQGGDPVLQLLIHNSDAKALRTETSKRESGSRVPAKAQKKSALPAMKSGEKQKAGLAPETIEKEGEVGLLDATGQWGEG